ncbi:MAG: polyphosphate:AMP phosphotransferase, partial [Candidatus Hinthialibacter sp.]
MLESLDLSYSIPKDKAKEYLSPLKDEWRDLQLQLKQIKKPVVIILEGLQASGKGDSMRRIVAPLDPRGFHVHLTQLEQTEEERLRPFLWRHWMAIPGHGQIGIFNSAWYLPSITERVNGKLGDHAWSERKDEIRQFERQLVDDGAILIKFWLHISKKEQKKRFKKMEKSKYEGWRVSDKDWKAHKKYNAYIQTIEDILVETDTPYAPWTLVGSDDRRNRRVHVMRTVTEVLKRCLNNPFPSHPAASVLPASNLVHPHEVNSILDRVDLTLSLTRKEYDTQLDQYQERLRELEFVCYQKRKPVVIVYEGWDAAGKGGNIKRLTQKLDPRGYDVIPIAAPQGDEANHHYLWRFWRHIPKGGHFAIFDRSWYGRVMVERIEGFCRMDEWMRAYYEINEFERHLDEYGMVIVKFWIHLSKEEQWKRFEERKNTPHKRHKITDEDYRNREK